MKIGLALGGGGSKGLAHIGIIQVLEENNIPIDYIAGTSAGALIGGLYAATKDINYLHKLAVNNNWPQLLQLFFDFSLRKGLIKGNKISEFLDKTLGQIEFKDLKIPFAAVVTDLSNAQPVAITAGKVALAIRASGSIPLIFNPVTIENKLYVDGGLCMPVPVEIVRRMGADFVIAVNLNEDYVGISPPDKSTFIQLTNKTTNIITHYLAHENVKSADFVISPKVGKFGLFKQFFTKQGSEEAIMTGKNAADNAMPTLLKQLKLKTPSGMEKFIKSVLDIFRSVKTS